MLEKLKRTTDPSKNLISQLTNKSFRGTVQGTGFTLISSFPGFGAFCVMRGEVFSTQGKVRVEVHKVFRVFLSLFLLLPVIGLALTLTLETEDFSPILLLVICLQILLIRFFFIELAFRFLSKLSLTRFRGVLGVEWT
jgi:hypothetical protein